MQPSSSSSSFFFVSFSAPFLFNTLILADLLPILQRKGYRWPDNLPALLNTTGARWDFQPYPGLAAELEQANWPLFFASWLAEKADKSIWPIFILQVPGPVNRELSQVNSLLGFRHCSKNLKSRFRVSKPVAQNDRSYS
jgi:hypothetical protein